MEEVARRRGVATFGVLVDEELQGAAKLLALTHHAMGLGDLPSGVVRTPIARKIFEINAEVFDGRLGLVEMGQIEKAQFETRFGGVGGVEGADHPGRSDAFSEALEKFERASPILAVDVNSGGLPFGVVDHVLARVLSEKSFVVLEGVIDEFGSLLERLARAEQEVVGDGSLAHVRIERVKNLAEFIPRLALGVVVGEGREGRFGPGRLGMGADESPSETERASLLFELGSEEFGGFGHCSGAVFVVGRFGPECAIAVERSLVGAAVASESRQLDSDVAPVLVIVGGLEERSIFLLGFVVGPAVVQSAHVEDALLPVLCVPAGSAAEGTRCERDHRDE